MRLHIFACNRNCADFHPIFVKNFRATATVWENSEKFKKNRKIVENRQKTSKIVQKMEKIVIKSQKLAVNGLTLLNCEKTVLKSVPFKECCFNLYLRIGAAYKNLHLEM